MGVRKQHRVFVSVTGRWLALLAAVLLASAPVSVAHTPLPGGSDNAAAQYILPDGTIPALCVGTGDDPQDQRFGPHCPLCTITGSFALAPINEQLIDPYSAGTEKAALPRDQVYLPPDRPCGLGQRAPPA
ncbi:MAG: hypothetical protein AAF724_19335 [Pseudomonadota bacterium]